VTDWYYSREGQRLGPIEEADFHQKIESGEIHRETFVWRQGMESWQKYGELYYGESYQSGAAEYPCYECGRSFPMDEMVRHYQYMVCAECKPVFFQRLQEGAILPGMMGYMVYGGFWIRFLAKFIDNFITTVLSYIVLFIMMFGMEALMSGSGEEPPFVIIIILALFYLFMLSIPAAYNTFFIGKYQSTPGKMALSLKVVRPDGSPITYWRAFGRHFAEILSGLILMIGYIMAAFDDEKRALHDMICDTRVVKK